MFWKKKGDIEMYDELIIITKHFPFNNGETPAESFLENEIFCFAEKAKKIKVFACDAKNDTIPISKLPENAEAFGLRDCNLNIQKIKALFNGLKYLFKKDIAISDEYKRLDSFKKRMFLLYFAGKSDIKYSSIIKNIGNINNKKVLIYNFWFFDSARTAVLLKSKLSENNDVVEYSRAHRYDLYSEENSLNYLPLRRWLVENTDYVFPCSEDGRNYLLKDFSDYDRKIIVSFLGTVDHGVQKKKQKELTIISCSRIVPVKRIERIISALRILDEKKVSLKWIHFGDGDMRQFLTEQAKNLKNIKVEFFGNIKNSDLMKMYEENYYKCFVNVSESEGLPISIMEALSFGIPVIATDVGGTSEIVKEGKNGFLLKKDFTDDELADRILNIVNCDESLYNSLRVSARRIWENNFEYKNNINKLFENIK